jgi:hypothetical protein
MDPSRHLFWGWLAPTLLVQFRPPTLVYAISLPSIHEYQCIVVGAVAILAGPVAIVSS